MNHLEPLFLQQFHSSSWHLVLYALRVEMYEYSSLNPADKADMLWQKGLYIETYSDRFLTANLYFMDKFFVEVIITHHPPGITEIMAFTKGKRLDKYLSRIQLKELMK